MCNLDAAPVWVSTSSFRADCWAVRGLSLWEVPLTPRHPTASAPRVPSLAVNPATANPAPLGLYGALRQAGTTSPMHCMLHMADTNGWQLHAPPGSHHAAHLPPMRRSPPPPAFAGFALTTALLQGAKTQLSEPKGTTQVSQLP